MNSTPARLALLAVAAATASLLSGPAALAAPSTSSLTAPSTVTLTRSSETRTSAAAASAPSSITFHRSDVAAKSPDAAQKAVNAITCKATTEYAHRSSTAPGLPNVHGRITCSSSIPRITVQIAIYRDGNKVATGNSNSQINGTYKDNYATAPSCVTGSYHGPTSGSVVAPAGFTPSSASLYSRGSDQVVQCGACTVLDRAATPAPDVKSKAVKPNC